MKTKINESVDLHSKEIKKIKEELAPLAENGVVIVIYESGVYTAFIKKALDKIGN